MGPLIYFVRIYFIFIITSTVSGFSPSSSYIGTRPGRGTSESRKGTTVEDIDYSTIKSDANSPHPHGSDEWHHSTRGTHYQFKVPTHSETGPPEEVMQIHPETMKYYRYPISVPIPLSDQLLGPPLDDALAWLAPGSAPTQSSISDDTLNNFADYDVDRSNMIGGLDYENDWKFLNNIEKVAGKNEFLWKLLNENAQMQLNPGEKRSAFHAYKRQKLRTQFVPSVSVGAMTHLGHFFDHLKNNLDVLERKALTDDQIKLLEGDHPIKSLRHELSSESLASRPTGTAAFLHAIRTYRPSQRVRALVASSPEGYHGSNFLDPNYMWMGLGRK